MNPTIGFMQIMTNYKNSFTWTRYTLTIIILLLYLFSVTSMSNGYNIKGVNIYIYKRLKWFVKQHQVHKTK